MIARPTEMRASGDLARGDARKSITARGRQYMIAPTIPGLSESAVLRQLHQIDGEVARTLSPREGISPQIGLQGAIGPPVVVARMEPETAAALRQSAGGVLAVEVDEPLRYAAAPLVSRGVTSARGPGFATTLQVLNESEAPLEQVEVELAGQQWQVQGITGSDGKVGLRLYGELPDTLQELIVRPRAGHWGFWKCDPKLEADGVNVLALRTLSELRDASWGGRVLWLNRLPPEYRGAGVKVGLIDSGVATSHRQLGGITHGFATPAAAEGEVWSRDSLGHGTACAGIISAAWDTPKVQVVDGIRGYAADAELHILKLPIDARSSDLVAALDKCIAADIDVACIGVGCRLGSTIVEQRIVAAKQRGVAIVAAAGSDGGPVQFPASSPHVLAIGAIGQIGTFPDDSPHAAHAASAVASGGGFFVPAFSCLGPEVDLCGPGVAVITCQSPDGYVARDGTSMAAPHVAAVAALILAHHVDFRRDFAGRDARRVERLFQILKETAHTLGSPLLTGAGLPCAPLALGLNAQTWAPQTSLGARLEEMRNALRHAGLLGAMACEASLGPQAQRGPAFVAPLPLTPLSTPGPHVRLSELKAAMGFAGLSPPA